MTLIRSSISLLVIAILGFAAMPLQAEQLYSGDSWAAVATDQRAGAVGDIITIVISETSRATSSLRNGSSRSTDIGGGVRGVGVDEDVSLEFGGSYAGRGETVRSEQFVAQMSAVVTGLLDNGDLEIEGRQLLMINGEETEVFVRGRIRRLDIQEGNFVLSSRIANAEINYDGEGFVSRSAKPGLITRVFRFLGIS